MHSTDACRLGPDESRRAGPSSVRMLAALAAALAVVWPVAPVGAAQPPSQTSAQQQRPVRPLSQTQGQQPRPARPLSQTQGQPPGPARPLSQEQGQQPSDDAAAEEEPGPPVAARTFATPAAMIINYVRAANADDFESLTRQMVEALAASEDAGHQALAAGWTMYRVSAPGPNNNTVYVWLFDPVVEDANYAVAQLLNELFPEEVQQLYETYMGSFGIGQTPLELEPVALLEEPG